MYKTRFKEMRGNDAVFAMIKISNNVEVDEVVVSPSELSRANLNTDDDKLAFMRRLRHKWLRGFSVKDMFDGLVDSYRTPKRAQALIDALGIPEAEAVVYHHAMKMAHASEFFNHVRGTADNTELGIK